MVNPIDSVDTTKKLSKLAGVGKETYRMGAKILNSDNEKLKQEILSGEKSINAGYRELTGKRIRIYNRSQIWERYIIEIIFTSVTVSQNGNAHIFTE